MQRVDHPIAGSANAQALDDLEIGASGIALTFRGAASARGFGLGSDDASSIGRALKDVRLDLISSRLESGAHGRRTAEALAQWVANEPFDPRRLDVSFGMDPIGAFASHGDLAAPWNEISGQLAETAARLEAQGFRGPFAESD